MRLFRISQKIFLIKISKENLVRILTEILLIILKRFLGESLLRIFAQPLNENSIRLDGENILLKFSRESQWRS